MKKIKQVNNWIIKEKRHDEVPSNLPLERCYAIFSPNGKIFQEDNLTWEEAIEFCQENKDYIGNIKGG